FARSIGWSRLAGGLAHPSEHYGWLGAPFCAAAPPELTRFLARFGGLGGIAFEVALDDIKEAVVKACGIDRLAAHLHQRLTARHERQRQRTQRRHAEARRIAAFLHDVAVLQSRNKTQRDSALPPVNRADHANGHLHV